MIEVLIWMRINLLLLDSLLSRICMHNYALPLKTPLGSWGGVTGSKCQDVARKNYHIEMNGEHWMK